MRWVFVSSVTLDGFNWTCILRVYPQITLFTQSRGGGVHVMYFCEISVHFGNFWSDFSSILNPESNLQFYFSSSKTARMMISTRDFHLQFVFKYSDFLCNHGHHNYFFYSFPIKSEVRLLLQLHINVHSTSLFRWNSTTTAATSSTTYRTGRQPQGQCQ